MSVITQQYQKTGTPESATVSKLKVFAMDGALLGMFMISACVACAIVEYPQSPVRHAIESDFVRRAIIGAAMGLTAVCLIYSPWGKRSGAFMNPAMVLSFLRLRRITFREALGYITAQFVGGTTGVLSAYCISPQILSDPSVNFVTTIPGQYGAGVAWLGEFIIAAIMMIMVLAVNKVPRLAPYTGCFAAVLVATYITFESPLSGMSLNPARTFSSATVAHLWTGWWIYLTAPVAGMLFGIELHRLCTNRHHTLCGKLNHSRRVACFIQCNCLSREQL